MEHDWDWQARTTARIGQRIAFFRARATDDQGRKLTAQALADRCTELGRKIDRPAISKLERGMRSTITVDEVQVLARALDVAPIRLLFPLGMAETETVEVLPGQHQDALDAILWFTGSGDAGDVQIFRTHRDLVDSWPAGQEGPVPLGMMTGGMTDAEGQRWRQAVSIQQSLRQIRALIRERGLTPPRLPDGMAWIDDQGAPSGAR